ncbi:copper resistance CopC/CopD family protein [Streptomyces sp. NBC_00083]|uniref:copper resistance CopC/CopD family protein n=1 Tax=Streptomyces sp. NBC_00083 TaxID=2975647 RepID=UPI00225B30D9|nr:copper resistance protein CopC [Streptomyces sp. NBC_00083]MCX5387641.1 copper resistance protein CopC [Streptomyces sp. NBC_00083]
MTATAPPRRTTTSRPLTRLLLVTVALLGALFAGAVPASAHAALTGSDPKDGAVVASAPAQVALTFSEGVALDANSIRVLDPTGKRSDTAELINLCSGDIVKYGVRLRTGIPNGTYTVAWQAISADSHPVSGAFTFSIGAPSATAAVLPTQEVGGGLVGALYGITRYAAYAGFVLLTGGAAFVLACWRRGAGVSAVQRVVVGGWLTMTAATLAMLLLRTPYTGSGKLSDAFDLNGLRAVLQTKPGAALISRLLLLGAAALFVSVLFGAYTKREDEHERKDLTFGLAVGGAVVAAGLAATWALAEHASTGLQPGIAMPVDVLHLLAVAAWLGGLTTLLVVLYRAPDIERAAVLRFSRIAFWSVAVLAATGLYQSWRQVGTWSALVDTAYGQLLLVKVGLVAVLVATASFSRRWTARLSERAASGTGAAVIVEQRASEPEPEPVTVPDDGKDAKRAAQLARQQAAVSSAREKRVRDADPGRSGLRRTVLAEAGIAVVLLAVTTVLTSTEPGRTQEAVDRAKAGSQVAVADRPVDVRLPFDTGGQNGKGTAELTLDPGRTGANDLHVYLTDPAGKPKDAPEVKVAFTLAAKSVGPLPVVPDHVTTGHWSASGVQIPMAGDWQISVTVRTSEIDETTVDKNVKIG